MGLRARPRAIRRRGASGVAVGVWGAGQGPRERCAQNKTQLQGTPYSGEGLRPPNTCSVHPNGHGLGFGDISAKYHAASVEGANTLSVQVIHRLTRRYPQATPSPSRRVAHTLAVSLAVTVWPSLARRVAVSRAVSPCLYIARRQFGQISPKPLRNKA